MVSGHEGNPFWRINVVWFDKFIYIQLHKAVQDFTPSYYLVRYLFAHSAVLLMNKWRDGRMRWYAGEFGFELDWYTHLAAEQNRLGSFG